MNNRASEQHTVANRGDDLASVESWWPLEPPFVCWRIHCDVEPSKLASEEVPTGINNIILTCERLDLLCYLATKLVVVEQVGQISKIQNPQIAAVGIHRLA